MPCDVYRNERNRSISNFGIPNCVLIQACKPVGQSPLYESNCSRSCVFSTISIQDPELSCIKIHLPPDAWKSKCVWLPGKPQDGRQKGLMCWINWSKIPKWSGIIYLLTCARESYSQYILLGNESGNQIRFTSTQRVKHRYIWKVCLSVSHITNRQIKKDGMSTIMQWINIILIWCENILL